MTPTIRIDDEVYAWLQTQASPFEDTPNSVLRRIAKLGDLSQKKVVNWRARELKLGSGEKTPQQAFRDPLLAILKEHKGEIQRGHALKELETSMDLQLTDYDRAHISSGTIRWQKSAEWEVRIMREEGLLKSVSETPRGVWALTDQGLKVANGV